MSDSKNDTPTDAPPGYVAAAQHGSLPARGPPPGKALRIFPLDVPILNALRGKRVILASASPRRKQLLAQIGLVNVEILPSTKPENLSKKELTPLEYVFQTSQQKCLDVYQVCVENSLASIPDPALVISADTVIVTNTGAILEKPRSEADHVGMLKMLRDQVTHKVFTAVTVLAPREDARHPGYNCETVVEETKVVFDAKLKDSMILAYVKTREGADKAGGYGIQGMGALLVDRIEGDYNNVVGLPLRPTLKAVERVVLRQDDDDDEEGSDEEEGELV